METTAPVGRRSCALDAPTARRESPHREAELVELVRAAAARDDAAWAHLVQRFDGMLRGIARRFGLGAADVDDLVQVAWMRLFTSIGGLENPASIGGWLATTTRRECLRFLQRRIYEQLTEDPLLGDGPEAAYPEARLVAAERRAVLADALAGLPERHRRLMVLLAIDPTTDYRRIGELLAMPTGSIGPIRRRCLTRLARDPRLRTMWSAEG